MTTWSPGSSTSWTEIAQIASPVGARPVHRAEPDRTGVVAGLEDGEGGVAVAPPDRAGPRADAGQAAGRHTIHADR
jgi:hypothetical protein